MKETLRERLTDDQGLQLPALVELAKALGKVVSILDLETTTFMGQKTFGITEVAVLHISPKGRIAWTSDFVNPENPIHWSVTQKTGITQKDVATKPTWQIWAEGLNHIAKTHWVSGFNIRSFDIPAIHDQNLRYKVPAGSFDHAWDLRSFWIHQVNNGKQKGKLEEVAEFYDVRVENSHRARDDVRTVALILEQIAKTRGIDFMLGSDSGKDDRTPVVTHRAATGHPWRAMLAPLLEQRLPVLDLVRALQEAGFAVEFQLKQRTISGWSLARGGDRLAASEVNPNWSWNKIVEAGLVNYDPDRDWPGLKKELALKEAAPKEKVHEWLRACGEHGEQRVLHAVQHNAQAEGFSELSRSAVLSAMGDLVVANRDLALAWRDDFTQHWLEKNGPGRAQWANAKEQWSEQFPFKPQLSWAQWKMAEIEKGPTLGSPKP